MQDFLPTGFSHDIFKDRYAFTSDETWSEACRRVAKQMAVAETPDKIQKYEDRFYNILVKNLFIPGGRILYNSGRPNPQLLNCFVLRNNLDSKEGWANVTRDMIITSMCGGGCGIDFSDVRPRNATINGHKGKAPGPMELMKMVNGCGDPIRAGGSRRTALMFSLDLEHSSVEEFLDIKLNQSHLKLANISVKSNNTTKFIDAINNDDDWELSWKGKYKHIIKARDIWRTIYTNAWQSAEPGFLNWELVSSENTISYITDLTTCNPCGEIVLESNSSCCLGHLVLPRFIKNDKVLWEDMGECIRMSVRFLDNTLSVNTFPLPEMKAVADNRRRIGLGVTGLADMLAILGYKYGSEDGNKFVDKLFRFISKNAYESSIMLAIEKGPFPDCKPEQHIKTGFVKRMTPKIKNLILDHGIRNCALLTVAPTGTVSIVSNNCSSGIEPMMASAYERSYYYGDQRKTELVMHPLFKRFLEEGKDVSHFIGSRELSVREHMEVQKIIQRHIDHSVSKTINIPENYPVEDMATVWLEYLPYLKGTTFYRENSRKMIDNNGKELPPPISNFFTAEEAIELYKNNKNISEKTEEQTCKNGICEL